MSNRKPLSRGQKIAIWAIVVPVMVAAINWFVKSKSPQQLQNAANTVSGNQNIIGNNNTIVQPSVEVPAQAPSKTIRNRPQKKTAQEIQSPPATRTANAPNGIAITGGTVTNPTVNNYGPPPVEIRFDEHSIQSTDPEFEYEAEVTVSASASYTPVSLEFICDSEIKKVSFDFGRFGAVLLNVRNGVSDDNKIGFVAFDGTAVAPERPLYVHIWGSSPFRVTGIRQAKLNL
jgi:hypothetical protein